MNNKYLPSKKAYVMYGTEFPLSSGKVRSYLHKKSIVFTQKLSDLKTYRNFIEPKTEIKFILIIQTPGNIINELYCAYILH